MAVQTSVYISEYGQYGTVYGQYGTVYGQYGTVWSLFGTVWSLFSTVGTLFMLGTLNVSFSPNKSIVGTLYMGPWIWVCGRGIWDPGYGYGDGITHRLGPGNTPRLYTWLYPGYTLHNAPVHACTRTVPATPCSTLSPFCQNCI